MHVPAQPYPWPYNGDLRPGNTALIVIDMQTDFCGKGGYVEVPMLESMVSFNLVEHFYGHHFAPPLADTGYPRLFARHRRPYRTADGYLCAMPYTDAHWQRFFTEGGMPEAAADPRFANITERTLHIDALYTLAAQVIETRGTDEWLAVFARLEVPASRMNRLEDLAEDLHLKATG